MKIHLYPLKGMYSYDRRTAASKPPVQQVLDKWWNQLHDFEAEVKSAARVYDQASSYNGGPGERDAKAVLQAAQSCVRAIEQVSKGGGALDKLWKAEGVFFKKHGHPDSYIWERQEAMGLK